jgi:hypothetical protein
MEVYYGDRARQCRHTSFDDGLTAGSSSFNDVTLWAFYGPCCKYALSPVGRYAKLWNVPVITSGGLTRAFSNRTSFPLLVRTVPPYKKLATFLVNLLSSYQWYHIAFLYHENLGAADQAIGLSECYHMTDALLRAIDPLERLGGFSNGDSYASESLVESDEASAAFYIPRRDYFNEAHMDWFDFDDIFEGIRLSARSMFPE